MTSQYHCPNCKASLASTAVVCQQCGASFSAESAWRPQTLAQIEHPPPGVASVLLAALGISVLVATFIPAGSRVLVSLTGGMYGAVFKPHSPALFLAVSYGVNYLPLAVLVWVVLRHFKVMQRVPRRYRGASLFGIGVMLILLYSTMRVLAATVPGGGAGFAVASLSPLIVLPALVLLVIAVVRLCIGFGKGVA